MIGKLISHYKILEKLGGGGMGIVYKAEDTKLHRTVALKFLPTELTRDEEAKQRFINEAQAASSLQHHNVCTIHDIDETGDGQMFICMDCYEGETLKDKISRGPLKLEEAIDISIQIAEGLQSAHEHGIIHRDIKPANIFITNNGIVKILDFGLAKLSGKTMMTKIGSTLGTIAYMSPEQAKGEEVDQRTDIWSLGIVVYEMLTGLSPFKGEYEQAILYSIISEESSPITSLRTGVPLDLERIVNKTMAKKPAERYQHIDELIVDLKKLLKDSDSKIIDSIKPAIIQKKPFLKEYKKYLIAASILFIIVSGLLILKPLLLEDVLISKPMPIAVITFENQTGDNSFDYLQKAIPNLLITNLEQSKFFRVTTWERMQDLLNQMGKPNVKVIDEDLGFDLCRRDGVDIIVIGSYIKAGNIFATDVKVLDVTTKQIIKSVSAKGEGIGSILESQIDDLSKEISQSIGISYSKITATKMKVIDVTTNSMEAYNYFLNGRDNHDKFYFNEAREDLEKAVKIDSTFAAAFLDLARTYSSLQETKKRNEAIEKAHLFSLKATEKEKLMINAYYASVIERNDEKRLHILKELVSKYPKEKIVYYDLGVYYATRDMHNEAIAELNKALELDPLYGAAINQIAYIYSELGNYEKTIEYLKKYSELNPKDANPLDSMADYYWRIGNIDLAIEYYLKAIKVKSDFFESMVKLSYIFAMKENYKKVEIWINKAMEIVPSSGGKATIYWVNAFFDSWCGKINKAIENLNKARELSRILNNSYIESGSDWLQAYILYDTGKLEFVNHHYLGFLDYVNKYSKRNITLFMAEYKFLLGLVNTKQNLIDSAKTKLVEIKSLMPKIIKGKNLIETRYDLLNAEILLAENSSVKAITAFQNVTRQNIPTLGYPEIVGYNLPFMRNGLARAYHKAGQLDNAINEYERLTTYNPQDKDRYLIHPRYHYSLAILYEEKGIKDKAILQYKKFLELWKDADKDLPELIDSKKRLSKLYNEKYL